MKSLKYIPLIFSFLLFGEVFAATGDICINTALSSVTFSVTNPPVCINSVLSTRSFTLSRQSPVVFVEPTPTVGPGGGGGGGGSSASIFIPQTTPRDTPNPVVNSTTSVIPKAGTQKTPPKKFVAKPLFQTQSIFAADEAKMPISVTPHYFPATGVGDWSDNLLKNNHFITYSHNPLVSTTLPYWSRISAIPFVFDERRQELPSSARNAPFYVVYDAIGLFSPIYLMPNQTKEPSERQYLDALHDGTIHLVGTGYPEDSRTDPVVVVGHSASLVSEKAGPFAAIFKTLPLAHAGDILATYTKNTDGSYGETLYRVREIRENVSPKDMSPITDYSGKEVIELVTCYAHGLIGALESRIVVIAEKI